MNLGGPCEQSWFSQAAEMDSSNPITLGNFVKVYKIGDVHKWSRFLSGQWDGSPTSLHTRLFFHCFKKWMHAPTPRFYRACDIDGFHCLVGFLFFIFMHGKGPHTWRLKDSSLEFHVLHLKTRWFTVNITLNILRWPSL